MLGKTSSPFTRTSTAFPPTTGAAVSASMVGKNEGSESDTSGRET
jgi:hypothetical protein